MGLSPGTVVLLQYFNTDSDGYTDMSVRDRRL